MVVSKGRLAVEMGRFDANKSSAKEAYMTSCVVPVGSYITVGV